VTNLFIARDGRLRGVWRAVIAALLLWIVVGVAAELVASSIPSETVYQFTVKALNALLALAASVLLLRWLDQIFRPMPDLLRILGFTADRRALADTFLGLVIGFVLVTLAVLAIAAFGRIHPARVPITVRTGLRAAAVLATLIVAALAEELQFRLYPFRALAESVGVIASGIIMSVLFAGVHAWNPSFTRIAMLNTAIIGGLLAFAYIRTRTVWMIWAIHFSWNFVLGVIYGLPVSGLRFDVAVRSTTAGPRWLTGGNYGIEGALTGAVVSLLGFPLVWFVTRSRQRELALQAEAPPPPMAASSDEIHAPEPPNASNE
jgi:membrane protease YdiL (CAAX protease family)